MSTLRVYNPMGYPPQVTHLHMAPRYESLEGHPIYLIDTQFDDGDMLLEQIQLWFQRNRPELDTHIVMKPGVYTEDTPALWEEIKANKGVAIMAVGH